MVGWVLVERVGFGGKVSRVYAGKSERREREFGWVGCAGVSHVCGVPTKQVLCGIQYGVWVLLESKSRLLVLQQS